MREHSLSTLSFNPLNKGGGDSSQQNGYKRRIICRRIQREAKNRPDFRDSSPKERILPSGILFPGKMGGIDGKPG